MIFENAYPLSKLQEGMIFYSEKDRSDIYHDIFIYSYKGYYDFSKIYDCFQLIAEQNPVLRTSFQLDKFSEPIQLVNKKVNVEVDEHKNFKNLVELDKGVNDYVAERKNFKFDWATAPLWKVSVFKSVGESFVICLDFHHSILDGWSVATLMQSFSEYYFSFIKGETPENQFLTEFEYDQYIQLEKQSIDDKTNQMFWENEVKQSDYTLLSSNKVTGSHRNIVSEEYLYDSDIVEKLKELSKRAKIPMKIICLSAHLKVLSLLTNKNKVTTGIISNGRTGIGGDNVLGLFLNTLPFTMDIKSLSWCDFLFETFEKEKNLMPFRRYPLSEMVRNFSNGKDIFDVVFNYVDFHVYQEGTVKNEKFTIEDIKVIEKTNFPFSIQFVNNPINNNLCLSVIYDQELFEQSFITKVVKLFQGALEAMINNELITDNIKILSHLEDERFGMINVGSANAIKEDVPSFIEKFLMCVEDFGDKIAVSDNMRKVTYIELERYSNKLANYFLLNGISTNDKIGVYLDRSIHLIISILAIWKVGAVYIPIDRKFPLKRIEYIINDLNIKNIISSKETNNDSFRENINLLYVEDGIAVKQDSVKTFQLRKKELAYVIYTSGTTGNPKGVCVSHDSIANLINHYHYDISDKVLMTFNIAFDGCLFDILISLASGASLCVPTNENLVGENLENDIRNYGITVLTLTPTVLSNISYQEFSSLRMISVAGEKCPLALAKTWGTLYKFRNLYGPSEGTICSTEYEYDPIRDKNIVDLPIGKPMGNVEIYIVDSNLQPVPRGVVGEMCISGKNLAIGYTNKDETSKSFKQNIFNLTTNLDKIYYLSGDRAKLGNDGNLIFIGRDDNQVKVNGIRMEISEIESMLESYSGIAQSIVRVNKESKTEKLVAFIILKNNFDEYKLIEEIEKYLKEYLPLYMIPNEFRILSSMPQNFNGKLETNKLEQSSRKLEKYVSVESEPRNDSEQFVHNLISNAISKEKISIFDNILELGCNSLMILEIQKKINATYHIEMSIQNIFDNPTVEKISLEILRQLVKQNA